MENSSPHQVVLLPNSHNMLLLSLLITVLIENVRTEQPNDVQQADQSTKTLQHYDFSDETAEKGHAEIAPAGLSELGQSSSQTQAPKSNISYPLNSPTEVEELDGDQIITADQQQIEITLPRSVIERMLMQNMAAETEAEAQQQNQKNGLKISCLVISVSTTGILGFLTGFPRSSQSSMTSKPLFKAGLVSMCASLFFALILLTLSTNRAKFFGLNQTVRIIIWISTGLMSLALVLLLIFYLNTT